MARLLTLLALMIGGVAAAQQQGTTCEFETVCVNADGCVPSGMRIGIDAVPGEQTGVILRLPEMDVPSTGLQMGPVMHIFGISEGSVHVLSADKSLAARYTRHGPGIETVTFHGSCKRIG